MWNSDEMPQVKLILSGKEYLPGKTPNLKLESLKPGPGAQAILAGLEITGDIDLYRLIVNAAEQRSIRVQLYGREFTAELATKNSHPGPVFSGKIVLRQCSPVRDISRR
jgi:hypothetical protein